MKMPEAQLREVVGLLSEELHSRRQAAQRLVP